VAARFRADESRRLEADCPGEAAGVLIFPTPEDSGSLSILALREALGVAPEAGPCFFFDHPWYLDDAFGREPCPPGWHRIAMAPLADSLDQPVYHAETLRDRGLYLPRASEVALMLFLRMLTGGEHCLERKHTWTRDRTSNRRFVSVGAFGKKGLFVSSHEVGYSSRGLGICPRIG
jgi:hypothetical protein